MNFNDVVLIWQTFWPALAGGGACYMAIRVDMAVMHTRIEHIEKHLDKHSTRIDDIERRSGFDRRNQS